MNIKPKSIWKYAILPMGGAISGLGFYESTQQCPLEWLSVSGKGNLTRGCQPTINRLKNPEASGTTDWRQETNATFQRNNIQEQDRPKGHESPLKTAYWWKTPSIGGNHSTGRNQTVIWRRSKGVRKINQIQPGALRHNLHAGDSPQTWSYRIPDKNKTNIGGRRWIVYKQETVTVNTVLKGTKRLAKK